MKSRTPWKEKLNASREREVKKTAKGRMLIPSTRDVDGAMRRVRKGKLTTVAAIREQLAREHRADFTCPLCTGIFARIAAEAAEEDRAEGKKRITPYWRTLKADGRLNEKYPGGAKKQAARLREEGHSILAARGKKAPKVADFEKAMMRR